MWQTYKYAYYWLYSWNKGLFGERDVPEWNAMLGLSMSVFCNIVTVLLFSHTFFGITLIPKGKFKDFLIPTIFFLLILNFIFFIFKKKYLRIEQEFKTEPLTERKRKGKWVILYAFGSYALLIFFFLFGSAFK